MYLLHLYLRVVPSFLTVPDLLLTNSNLSSFLGVLWDLYPTLIWAALYSVTPMDLGWSKAGRHQPNLAADSSGQYNFIGTQTFLCLPLLYDCFYATTVELNSCGRDLMACKD